MIQVEDIMIRVWEFTDKTFKDFTCSIRNLWVPNASLYKVSKIESDFL